MPGRIDCDWAERVVGFEPTTTCLGSRCATTAPHPLVRWIISQSFFWRKFADSDFDTDARIGR